MSKATIEDAWQGGQGQGKPSGEDSGASRMEHLCHRKECGLYVESSGEPWRALSWWYHSLDSS